MGQNPPACNVCQSNNTRSMAFIQSDLDNNEYAAFKCRRCGLVFAFPFAEFSFTDLQQIYGESYTGGQRGGDVGVTVNQAQFDAFRRQMDIVEKYATGSVALNVGAMNQAVKVLEERGWDLHILDVSSYAAETARSLWGFKVEIARIEDFVCPPETFDFIKLGHVIEHLADPRKVLQKLVSLLKPGGVILIETDNACGLKTQVEVIGRRLLGENLSTSLVKRLMNKNLRSRYGSLMPPLHLYNFSPKSLIKLLEDTGFTINQVIKPARGDSAWFPLKDRSSLSTVEKMYFTLDEFGARFGLGDLLVVIATRI